MSEANYCLSLRANKIMNKTLLFKAALAAAIIVGLSNCAITNSREILPTSKQMDNQKSIQLNAQGEVMSKLEQGQQYVNATQANLGKNLIQAITDRGAVGALEFCQVNAIPLTERTVKNSMVNIKRVSDLNRNPANKPNTQELEYIIKSKEQLKNNTQPSPELIKSENKSIGYYPITTNPMCLQCHGTPEQDIKSNTLKKIQQLYPQDKALGYGNNELRGIWVVEMKN